jgi:hypothetical protein
MNKDNENEPILPKKKVNWQDDNERILKTWADKAQCFQVMHNRAHKRYWCLNAWFSIPVIIFSTVTGTANFAQGSVAESWKNHLIIGIGTLNLVSAIITTVAQFLGVAQKSEGHRLACVHWDKFARKVKIELSKIRPDRVACNEFLDTCQQDYDRLIETSPDIPTDIIRWFRSVIKKGNIDLEVDGIKLCIYECCCFPCGTDCCNKKTSCLGTNDDICHNNDYSGIELPEIIGSLKPTRINKTSNETNDNEYSIYNENAV